MNENLKPVLIAGAGPTGLMAALSCWIQHSCPPDREKGRTRDHFTSNRGPGKNAVRRQNKLDGLNERDGVSSWSEFRRWLGDAVGGVVRWFGV